MKIRFIYPKFNKFLSDHPDLKESLSDYLVGDYTMPPSLGLPILAALTPPDIDVFLTDDNIDQPIDYHEDVDLIAISCFTPQAERAYEIADEYRKQGKRVVFGGIHPSLRPQEAHEHADAVCVGEGEPLWPEVINDIRNNTLKEYYNQKCLYNLADFPIPKREIFPKDIYKWNAHLVLTMRGCPARCSGCPIPPKEGFKFRYRPIDNIIADIKQMPYREFYFTDDTIMLPSKKNQEFILNLMERTGELDVKVFLASTMMMSHNYDLYSKLRAGGAASMYTIFGFDRISKHLFSDKCTREEWQKSVDLVRMIEDNDIHFFASFGIGFDDQNRNVVDRILRFTEETGIDLAEFYIITPFPGTPFGIQVEDEGRILHRNYSSWNHGNVVFKPKNWTEEELLQDFYTLWNSFYKNKDPQKTIRSFTINNDDHDKSVQ